MGFLVFRERLSSHPQTIRDNFSDRFQHGAVFIGEEGRLIRVNIYLPQAGVAIH